MELLFSSRSIVVNGPLVMPSYHIMVVELLLNFDLGARNSAQGMEKGPFK